MATDRIHGGSGCGPGGSHAPLAFPHLSHLSLEYRRVDLEDLGVSRVRSCLL